MNMMSLQCRSHFEQVLAALENKTEWEILIVGDDKVTKHSDSLWIFSPFIRSILGSLRNITENLIILPDFSYHDIQRALNIIEGKEGKSLLFNSSTRKLLETLGIVLNNIEASDDISNNTETENTDEKLDFIDDNEEERT